MILNVFDSGCVECQTIWWDKIQQDITYEFELILPYHAKVVPYKEGAYMYFVAIALQDYKEPDVMKDTTVALMIPWKTFARGMDNVPFRHKRYITRQEAQEKNVLIRFKKIHAKKMEFMDVEPKDCTQEQRQACNRIYVDFEKRELGDTNGKRYKGEKNNASTKHDI